MYDDFRNAISDDQNEDEEGSRGVAPFSFPEEESEAGAERPRRRIPQIKVPREVMSMTPMQNFIISLLLFLMVVIGGLFFLLITGKMMLF